jgi:glutamate synthase (NADPH) small chain
MDQLGLHELEDQCIQEHIPACAATCPARVDVRGICTELIKGDQPAALKILRKTIPFPGIISRICDQPCREKCIRKDVGEAIAISSLERACVDFGGNPDRSTSIPHRDSRLAVIGAGLFGLTAAYDLARKGYQITVFEKTGQLGGIIQTYGDDVLPKEVIEKDFSFLMEIGVHFVFNCSIEKITPKDSQFEVNNELFDAVLISSGENSFTYKGVEATSSGILIDPVSYATSIEGVFSGGNAASWIDDTVRKNKNSHIFNIADGHRVATSIDRFFQHVSLTAARLKEGSYETRLFTSIEGIIPSDAITPTNLAYTQEEALEEANRCLLCQCLECVKVCEYLKDYGSYPKRYVREIYNNLSIVKGERRKNQFINSCSLCGLCGEVCPTDLNMGKVNNESRREMVKQNRMPPSAHDFALRDMAFSNSEHFSLVRNQPGTKESRYLFFPGCQLSASNPQYVEKLYNLFRESPEFGGNGGIGLALRCCGAPARWAGREEVFQKTREEFLKEYSRLGKPEIILACSSCNQVFKEEYPEIPIRSLYTVLETSKLPGMEKHFAQNGKTISIHDPCTTRYESSIHESIRSIISGLGYKIEELPLNRERTECCSYGGLMWLANPPLAKKVVDRRINESPHTFVTYCAMCRDFFNKQGKSTYHILDLLFNETSDPAKSRPADYSVRHANRAKLKKQILFDLWGETMEPSEETKKYDLNIPENMRMVLEERLILEEDIQRVLNHAESTGLILKNKNNDHLLAYFCPAYVTYWVEYTKEGNVFTIYNAYSHRMTIDEGQKS